MSQNDVGRPFGQPAGGPSDLSPQAVSGKAAHQAQDYPIGYPCPFDGRLARTPYFVLPKLAIQVMPMEWRIRFDALLQEMEDAGLETPVYEVVPAGGEIRQKRCRDRDDWRYGETIPVASIDDPWADYRHMQVEKVKALCPNFASAIEAGTAETENTGSVHESAVLKGGAR